MLSENNSKDFVFKCSCTLGTLSLTNLDPGHSSSPSEKTYENIDKNLHVNTIRIKQLKHQQFVES